MKLVIMPGEGGKDAQLLAKDLYHSYLKALDGWLHRHGPEGQGYFIELKKPNENLKKEVGGHRFQRVPPTERKGRVHTSSVKVALIDAKMEKTEIRDSDLRVEWFSGTGKGGQHRNKHQCSCRLIHIPTGLVEVRQSRSRESNYQEARQALSNKLSLMDNATLSQLKTEQYKESGSGQRDDQS